MTDPFEGSVSCADDGCAEFRFDGPAALREGWDSVKSEPFCPLHWQEAARHALAAAEIRRLRARVEELRAERSRREAQSVLSDVDYAKWDEFQSDMANFHKKTGKLAPAVLRTLDPKKWLAQYTKTGRIDVELAADSLFAAEARADKTRDWLMRRL